MANRGYLEINLMDVRDDEVQDPRTRIVVSDHNGRQIHRINHTFPGILRIEVPAFPQARHLDVDIVPSRYRRRPLRHVMVTHGATARPPVTALRRPDRWKPEFERWDDLPASFDALKQVLSDSRGIRVRGGPSLDDYTEAEYDDSSKTVVANAKAGLLNLFAKLSEEEDPTAPGHSWFSYVQEIEVIGKSSFIARVLPEMGESVKTIRRDFAAFPRYEPALVGNHAKNFPAKLQIQGDKMYSVKTDDRYGNLQLTFAPGVDADDVEALYLDTDIDENGKLFLHLIDVFFIHPFSGGTRPLDIHEYLALAYPRRDLGYYPVVKESAIR